MTDPTAATTTAPAALPSEPSEPTGATGIRHAVVTSSVGELTLVGDGSALTGVYFPGHWTHPDEAAFGRRVDLVDDAVLAATAGQLGEYLAGERREFDLPLRADGTDRARQLWALLEEIPYGTTTTYGELAARMGQGISARAVGGFVGHNPISIVVPCHRVVGSTGRLTGYAGGLERKQRLLELEGALAPLPLG